LLEPLLDNGHCVIGLADGEFELAYVDALFTHG
jgi:hypothetical protein